MADSFLVPLSYVFCIVHVGKKRRLVFQHEDVDKSFLVWSRRLTLLPDVYGLSEGHLDI